MKKAWTTGDACRFYLQHQGRSDRRLRHYYHLVQANPEMDCDTSYASHEESEVQKEDENEAAEPVYPSLPTDGTDGTIPVTIIRGIVSKLSATYDDGKSWSHYHFGTPQSRVGTTFLNIVGVYLWKRFLYQSKSCDPNVNGVQYVPPSSRGDARCRTTVKAVAEKKHAIDFLQYCGFSNKQATEACDKGDAAFLHARWHKNWSKHQHVLMDDVKKLNIDFLFTKICQKRKQSG